MFGHQRVVHFGEPQINHVEAGGNFFLYIRNNHFNSFPNFLVHSLL